MKKVAKNQISQNLLHDIKISPKALKILIFVIIFCAFSYLIFVIVDSYRTNGYFSFPLDDPWIHLQFAKNLNHYGSFSYYKDTNITSGSTAPLYTFLLSIGFNFTSNEFVLSYTIGIIFFIASLIYFYYILNLEFQSSTLITIFGTLFFGFMWKLHWAALSGMETTMAIFFLISSIYYYKKNKWILFSIFSGLFLWVRPEALIFNGVVLLDWLYKKYWMKEKFSERNFLQKKNELKVSLLILIILSISYFIFNYSLSGTFFPNTFSAKIKYYSGGNVNYLGQLYQLFTESDLIILSVFSIVGFLVILYKIITRNQNEKLIFAGWVLGMILAYGLFLPYLYQKGRYLFPVFPAYLVLGIYGIILTLNYIYDKFKSFVSYKKYLLFAIIILGLITLQFFYASLGFKKTYIEDVKYIYDRQITTAKWLNKNLPQQAIIATHDIGAIAYYSNLQVVDMVGLVSPEMIPNIGSFDRLKRFLNSKKVTHIATLRNWFHIKNQNPIFITNESTPEVMEVFEYSKNSDFVPQDIVRINEEAEYFLNLGEVQRAMFLLNQSISFYPDLDWTNFLIGKIFMMAKEYNKAKLFFENTLRLNPNHLQAKQMISNLQ
ncbi:MAG: putative membrane protein of unknown function [Ignavibacteriae bacterium]|nr:MAG: putative membrane protein of unknown function [Ignavibacteriota bacterium]